MAKFLLSLIERLPSLGESMRCTAFQKPTNLMQATPSAVRITSGMMISISLFHKHLAKQRPRSSHECGTPTPAFRAPAVMFFFRDLETNVSELENHLRVLLQYTCTCEIRRKDYWALHSGCAHCGRGPGLYYK